MQSQVVCAAQGCYYVHPQIQGVLESGALESAKVKPVILISFKDGMVDNDRIVDTVEQFKITDDVFSSDFLNDTIIVQSSAEILAEGKHPRTLETSYGPWGIKSLLTLRPAAGGKLLPNGPYFLFGKNLHQAWRLYPDNLDCFATTVVQLDTQSTESKFDPLLHLHSEGVWKSVAVPSRLYAAPTEEKPLSGQRISIKDCYRLRGIKTTLSSRPFEETYGPDTETAAFVQEIIDLGAVIVDFHAPFNPRGDGYQTPAGSSNGAAAALAGYPWLDYSIGTDTSGSIRYPAALCGLHALRYTSHTIPMTGIWPGCRELDAIGLLGRDLKSVHDFVKLTAKDGPGDITQFPKRILYPTDFFPYGDSKMQAIVDEFLNHLENYLGVKKTTLSISESWMQCPPVEANGRSIKMFLEKVGFYPFYYDGYHEYAQFRRDYREKFQKEPYVGPYMQWKWETGSQVSLEQKEQSLQDMRTYRKWVSECILQENEKTASDAILIMPLDTPAPDYRDTPHRAPGPISSFSETYTASILGLPQLVLMIGQVPYESRVSKRTEYHPVSISLVGARGSDLMLVNLAQRTLEKAGWSDKLLTGRNTFEVGGGVRYVAEGQGSRLAERP